MKTIKPTSKIEFANSLRGIAVLLVLFGHYVFLFNYLKGQYGSFPPIDQYPFPGVNEFLNSPIIRNFNAGQIAVALFFLVSGLVIPNSVASLAHAKIGRVAFVIGRIFRIWPTYAVGLLISVYALWLNTQVNSADFYQPWPRIFTNMTLFRDWMGEAQIDGVVWTLETEAKFYLFILLFWSAISKGRLYPMAIICVVALVAAPEKASYEGTLGVLVTSTNYLWALPYILYMSIGIVFNYHLRGILSTKLMLAVVSGMFTTFVIVAKTQHMYDAIPTSYGATLLAFILMYFFARNWSGGPVIRFYAQISFPLYACHAPLGYSGMAYMMTLGINPFAALAIQIMISTGLAWVLHLLIESPTHNAGKYLGKKLIALRGSLVATTKPTQT